MPQTEQEIVEGIGSDYAIKYGFSVTGDYFYKSGAVEMNRLIQLQMEGSVG